MCAARYNVDRAYPFVCGEPNPLQINYNDEIG